MRRIIPHWSVGTYKASSVDKKHYARIVEGSGNVVYGNHPISVNAHPILNPNDSRTYYAGTKGLNTDTINVAFAAMRGAKERPFNAGTHPILPKQYDAMINLIADLAIEYSIPVTRQTILTHAEVQPTLGIKQRGKWDIRWLPGMKGVGDAIEVGDKIRADVTVAMKRKSVAPSGMAALIKAILSIFGARK